MTQYDDIAALREKLGESIPDGGSAADTMFTDEQVLRWIDASSSTNSAILQGWHAKLANLSNLVNVTDGAASRELSDLFAHAQAMVKLYSGIVTDGPTAGRTRIGKIIRK